MNSKITQSKNQQLKSLFLGGILPVIIFTLLEEYLGTLWGLIGGMVFGIGEILWEWKTRNKVDPLTWGGNGMLILLGVISLVTQEGVWFKLQPAIIELVTAMVLWGSVCLGKSLFLVLAQKQGMLPKDFETSLKPGMSEFLRKSFQGLTIRLGAFFFFHGILAIWAALYWSTASWAILKGVGLTLSLIVYLVAEVFILRYRIANTR